MTTAHDNRDRLTARLATASKNMRDELSYLVNDVEHEGDYDIVDAFIDIEALAEDEETPFLRAECRRILIDVGLYVPMTSEEIRNTVTTQRHPWFFKRKGIAYQCVDSLASYFGLFDEDPA